jgi:hypothetical protein
LFRHGSSVGSGADLPAFSAKNDHRIFSKLRPWQRLTRGTWHPYTVQAEIRSRLILAVTPGWAIIKEQWCPTHASSVTPYCVHMIERLLPPLITCRSAMTGVHARMHTKGSALRGAAPKTSATQLSPAPSIARRARAPRATHAPWPTASLKAGCTPAGAHQCDVAGCSASTAAAANEQKRYKLRLTGMIAAS